MNSHEQKLTALASKLVAENQLLANALKELAKSHSPEWLLQGVGQNLAESTLANAKSVEGTAAVLVGADVTENTVTFRLDGKSVDGAVIGSAWIVVPGFSAL